MKIIFTGKNQASCSVLRFAARIISIMILAFLWPEGAGAAVTDSAPANWAAYGQTAGVGDVNAADVAVDGATYTVKTAKGLAWIGWVVNEGKTTADINETYSNHFPTSAGFEGCTVKLNDDISLAKPDGVGESFAVSWIPIGTDSDKSFKGTFDGNNKTISNMTITGKIAVYYIGLFGYLDGAIVENLTVEGSITPGSYTGILSSLYIGGIAGWIASTKIRNCHNKCAITCGIIDKSIYAGGIVAMNSGSSSISIYASSNSGNIDITGSSSGAGGIICNLNQNSKIASCFNSGSVTTRSRGYTGGIIGYGNNNSEVSNCYSTGKITIESKGKGGNAFCGGIAGNASSLTITSCYATGAVSATGSGSYCSAGGIAGSENDQTDINNCLALNSSVKATKNANRIAANGNNYTLSDNYASTKTRLQVGDDDPAFPTSDIGPDKVNGQSIYLDDVAAAIASWAGDGTAFTAIGTGENGKLPQLKSITGYNEAGEPTEYGDVISGQPAANLSTTTYLDNAELLLPKNEDVTITISCSGGQWSYVKDTDNPVCFKGTVKVKEGGRFTGKLVIDNVTDNLTLTFESVSLGSVEVKQNSTLTIHTTGTKMSIEGASLTNAGTLTLMGEGLDIKNNSSTTSCIVNTGTLTVTDPTTTAITLQNNGTAIENTGTLGNAWMEWQFVSTPTSIAFADTDDEPQAGQECNFKTHAAPVTAGKSYRLWKMPMSSRQQGKAEGGKSVISFQAPETNNIAVFTDVKNAIGVTLNKRVDGGSISVFWNNTPLPAKNEVVPSGAELTCKYNAVPGYEMTEYIATPAGEPSLITSVQSGSYTVPDVRFVAFTATFTKKQDAVVSEKDAVETGSEPTDPVTTPVVVIPSEKVQQPSITQGSSIKLLTGDLEESNKKAVDKEMKDTGVDHDKLIYAEIALVEVKSDGKKIPIQPLPDHPVTVIYPYPDGTDMTYTFTIVHLKTDGMTEVYSKANNNLENTLAGLKFTVTSFSPFGIAWKTPQTPDPGPGPEPTPEPTPTPVYYTVILPAVEGAVTDPVAGSYEVEAWDNFRFFLTLDKDYDQSVPVVTTDRGETIEPAANDGAYMLKFVRTPVTVSIAGIQKNTVVANDAITAGIKIWTEASALCIETDRAEEVRVVSLTGSTVTVFKSQPGSNRTSLSPGFYIVRIGANAWKVIVR